MKNRFALIALSSLVAGSAFAQMPAAGEGPFFANEASFVSTTTRAAVRAEAVADTPAAGTFDGNSVAEKKTAEQPTRAQVRQATREAVKQGNGPAAGTRS